MSETGHNNVNKDEQSSDLFAEAELDAKRELCEWIRSTLRQTFLEALPQTWTIEPGNRIAFSAEALKECLGLVQKVSCKWQEQLKQVGHDTTATWVEEVFRRGKDTLWAERINIMEEANHEELPSRDENVEQPEESSANEEKEKVDASNQQEEAVDPAIGLEEDVTQAPLEDSVKVPYSALRNLGKRAGFDQPYLSNPEAVQALKEMGESGASFWPLDWNLIDQVCSEIPRRFKAETGASNLSYEVVPKKYLAAQNNNGNRQDDGDGDGDEGGNNNAAVYDTSRATESSTIISPVTTVLSNLLERKRKKSKAAATTRKTPRPSSEMTSRPPSDISMSTHNVNEELSKAEKEQLDGLLHADEDEDDDNKSEEEEQPPMVSVFGPLDKVGTIHNQLYKIDNPTEDNTLTEKERRRRYRARIQERLDPRRVVKNKDIQRFPSRILRTEDRLDDSKKYLELDMGWSLMEIRSPTDYKKKRYCAFSSLEIVLEDKQPRP
jgi:hypothetical protein